MKTAEQIEREYMEFCDTVVRDARRVFGLAGAGRADDAANAAGALVQTAMTRKAQYTMQQHEQGHYDLSALKVDSSIPSDSETGWERRDD